MPGIIFHTLEEFPAIPPIQESGRTLRANSLIKAAFVYKLTGQPALADDSGLFIDDLNGRPGVISSRYGPNDQARIERVLRELKNARRRTAVFRAAFAYYYQEGVYRIFEGACPGRIINAPRGEHGFGYDPIFIPRGYKKTFAELGPRLKNRISHRAMALRAFKKFLINNIPDRTKPDNPRSST